MYRFVFAIAMVLALAVPASAQKVVPLNNATVKEWREAEKISKAFQAAYWTMQLNKSGVIALDDEESQLVGAALMRCVDLMVEPPSEFADNQLVAEAAATCTAELLAQLK